MRLAAAVWTVRDGVATPMDLDIIESVCSQIMGNCLCVLGDAMAMPVGSMIKHFRAEFEEHMERMQLAATTVQITDVNRAAIQLLGGTSAETLTLLTTDPTAIAAAPGSCSAGSSTR